MKPTVYQLVTDFRGTKQDSSILTLRDVWSSEGSQCVWMDKLGRVRKMDGVTAIAVTTTAYQVDAAACYPRSLASLYDPATEDWFLIALFRKDASTKDIAYGEIGTDVAMTKADDADNALHMDSAELDQIVYLAFGAEGGNEAPKTAVISGSSVTIADAGGTQTAGASAVAGSGTGLSGTYEWKIVAVTSSGSRLPGSDASTEIQLDNEDATVSWTAGTGTEVGYEVFRTTGTGKVFRYAGYSDGQGSGTINYTDSLSDDELLNNEYLVSHGEAPPSGVYWNAQWRQRIWWARTTANPTRIWWSDPGDGDSCDLTRNYLDLSEVDASATEITGLQVLEDTLYVSTRAAIWRISGTGEISAGVPDWLLRKTSARVGWTTTFSVSRITAGAVLTEPRGDATTNRDALVYASSLGDFRVFDGKTDYVISTPIKDDITGGLLERKADVHSMVDEDRGHVYFFIPSSLKVHIYNYRYGVWSRTSESINWRFGSSLLIPDELTSTRGHTLIVGTGATAATGKVYEFFRGLADLGGSTIDSRWWSKPIYGTDENGAAITHLRKRWRTIDPIFDANLNAGGTLDVDFHFYEGFADSQQSPTAFAKVTVTVQNPISTKLSHTQSLKRLVSSTKGYLHSEAIRFQVEEAGGVYPWALEGFQLGYQVFERVRDR